jgi:hypothetical protein
MLAIRDTWRGLSTPADSTELSAAHVPRTNVWVFKDHSGSFGLLLTGVDPPGREPRLKNIRVVFKPEKEVQEHGLTRTVPRCLEVNLDSSCSGDALAVVLERLSDKKPSGAFGTEDLLGVLEEGVEVFRMMAAPSSKEAVIGVWGELHLLELIFARTPSSDVQAEMVRAWEAEGRRRDILDFRFRTVRVAIEVKTSLGGRVHHIDGFGQVSSPPGYSEAFLASLRVEESQSGGGRTARDIAEGIRRMFRGEGVDRERFDELLDAKLERRGKEAVDDRYRLVAPGDGLAIYRAADVPRPVPGESVTDVQWTADLTRSKALDSVEVSGLFDKLVS